jgi:hypothetical protein
MTGSFEKSIKKIRLGKDIVGPLPVDVWTNAEHVATAQPIDVAVSGEVVYDAARIKNP